MFKAKIVYAIVASIGVALAAFYALRLFQGAMHNPLGEPAASREISLREGVVIAPLVACILALGVYPQLILGRVDEAVKAGVAPIVVARED